MRIVSLCPSLTELIFDLGLGDDLVGITKYCVHPADRVAALEKVGGTKNPKIERILDLAPDLVLMNSEENRKDDAEELAAGGVKLHSSMPRGVDETASMVRSIGKAVDRPAQAESIAADIENRARRVHAENAHKAKLSWAYLIWQQPLMTVNGDTFVSALLSLAGGHNVFADRADRYPEIEGRDLRAADPQRVFLGSEPFPFEAKHAAALADETGLPLERFVLADGQYLSWHGSRTPDGIDYAARLIAAARRDRPAHR